MGPLAVLPVFFKLEGRRVLLAGGSDAAAWKAELLAAAGAHVDVFAAEPVQAMADLLASDPERGAFAHHARDWCIDDFTRATLAVADAADEAQARAFACAARAAGVPFNVIDNPAYCTFQFGAIVNRSPAVIAISTDGAAPILGQAIRRRIETLLPQGISGWAGFARAIRAQVSARLKPGAQRRAFWEKLAETAFRIPFTDHAGEALLADAGRIETSIGRTGQVTLVGAGPGDADLLTLKAMRALQAADVILYDDLVSPDVLELARREAKRMLVGKRGGKASCKQEEINATMLKLARAGKHVVRLKSGDPMVFGRAGEEIEALEAAGIPVSVVPGITAALAMASALGVSLTHRDHARSVRFVTGHNRDGRLPADIDWRACADPVSTTIFYMGAKTAAALAARLMAAGLPGATPCAVAVGLSTADEALSVTTLNELGEACATLATNRPVLIGVGAVFGARAATQTAGFGPAAFKASRATSMM
ncbi:MAG: siroheme synthase CysG [Rhizobiaceae bacterium]|nr:siroheme synthase CysG [Rhizobiaceae bacterium]